MPNSASNSADNLQNARVEFISKKDRFARGSLIVAIKLKYNQVIPIQNENDVRRMNENYQFSIINYQLFCRFFLCRITNLQNN
jgi:hypothetical protein